MGGERCEAGSTAGRDRVACNEKNPFDPAVSVAQAPLTPPLDRWRQG